MAVFKSFKSFKYFDYKPLRCSRIGLHVILNPNGKKNWSPATCYGPHSARISSSWSQRFNEGIKERGGRLNLHILCQGPRRHTERRGCYKINSHSDLGFFLKVFFLDFQQDYTNYRGEFHEICYKGGTGAKRKNAGTDHFILI